MERDAVSRLARRVCSGVTKPPYTLTLLGGLDLKGPAGSENALLVQSKIVGMLAYLALPSIGRFVRRDLLAALLWPDLDQERARKAVRQSIHAVRATLGAEALPGRGDEEVALSAAHVRCDVTSFSEAADSGMLMEALRLYAGELLPGFHVTDCAEFDRWLDDERAAARERAAAVTWALAQRLESDNELSNAAVMARRSVRLTWTDERALRRALSMLDRLGDRAGAARLYDEFAKRLMTELEVHPSDETARLMARIRGNGDSARA